jgi:serine/threonine protein kinase
MLANALLDPSAYEIQQFLGRGSVGATYQVKHKQTERSGVLKILDHPLGDIDRVTQQLDKLIGVSHPTLAPVFGYCLPDSTGQQRFSILTSSHADRSLASWLSIGCTFVNDTKSQIILGVAEAIRHLHSLGIQHHALTPENVLLSKTMEPVVCDYGLDCCRGGSPATRFSVVYNEEDLTNLDVFDFGCLLYALFTGESPAGEALPALDETIPVRYRDLIRSAWAKPAVRRPSFESIVIELLSSELSLDISHAEADLLHQYACRIVPAQLATRHLVIVFRAMEELEQTRARLTAETDALQQQLNEIITTGLSNGTITAEAAALAQSLAG